ncbi:syntaxin-binding protein 5 isoform X1 [Cydia fagiglandana]|uniref:syntaxin-binding protein 5 isoform X1 n=2 Tax=Cydia fagiglandana TaxID=1458189 RepID=UPI002FEE22EC
MKKFTFKGVLDGFRSSVQAAPRGTEQEIQETLRSDHFQIKKTFRHGFPFSPTALAWDPIQKLLAIGDKGGNLRILGGPGVDAHARHEAGEAVVRAQFLVNEGALVTATADDQLHLWTFRQKSPQRVQSLKFQRERITCLHLPLQSKWVHVGTERGNVHVVNIETFALSGYVINWNKAIEVTRTNHPGAVVEISDNPLDANKLLVAYETGLVVVWDLRAKAAEWRGSLGTPGEGIRAAAWQHDGKFMTAHVDGALAVWNTRQPRPTSLSYPHAKANKDGKLEPCKPIHRLEWKTAKTGESLVIFSGGLPTDKAGRTHSITVLNGKSTTVLEMEHSVVDFVTLCESPHTADYQEPYAIVVLLQNDLVVIDLQTPGYPCFENPYPMDIHESPVTCCSYFADCPSDLIPAFYSVGRQGNKKATGFSEKEWPINGGEWAPASCSYSEIILTGHQDGSIKFWDASAGTLQILYKLKCSKVFERRGSVSGGYGGGGSEDSPLAIQQAALCAESRRLCAALPHGHVVLFKFRKQDTHAETHVLEIPMITDSLEEEASPEPDGSRSASFSRGGDSIEGESRRSGVWAGGGGGMGGLRVRGAAGTGGARRAAGFQAALVALQQGAPSPITALTINSSYGLMAWGGERGVVVVDVSRRAVVAALAAHALYGPLDPWGRHAPPAERAREPSLDQLEDGSARSPPAAATAPAAPSPAEPDDDERPKLDARRKSTPWKTFNLKRQLSKVDLKLKAAFAVPSEPNLEEKTEEPASTSQFYDAPVEKAEIAIESLEESPESESPREDEEGSAAASPARGDMFERMHKELQEQAQSQPVPTQQGDVYDRMHRELQERWQERDEATRPDSLALEEAPVRPPRAREREQRLLSVPNIKYGKKAEVRDLRRPGAAQGAPPASGIGNLMRRFNKLDSSFSRSRSSSMSSLENISQEGIQCLAFADSYTKKSDPTTLLPTLWIGTTLGSVLTMMISLPEADNRHTQPVVVSMSGGPIFRLKGSILAMSFLDCNGALIPYSFESWKDDAKDVRGSRERTPTKQSSSSSGSRMSPTPGAEGGSVGDRQFVVIASEKQARVVALPSQNCVYRQQIVDTDFVVKAEIVSLKDSVCLVNYLSTGHLAAYSLPSLRPLVHVDFLPLSELSFQTQSKQRGIVDPMLSIWGQQLIVNEDTDQIAKTFCFSNRGHGLYLASPTEIQKFTIDAEFCVSLNEMLGELFLPRDMPEPPKESFFRGLFGGGSRPLDREELFGEQSGKPNRTVAKVIPGPKESLDQLGARASTASSEVARAHMLVLERGDKLSQLEDRTERMSNEAAQFSSSAHQLMLKYKDKKWYQL